MTTLASSPSSPGRPPLPSSALLPRSSRPQGWQTELSLTQPALSGKGTAIPGWHLGPKPAYPHLSQKGPTYHPLRGEIMLAMPLPPGEGNSRSWQRRPWDPPAFEASLSANSGPQGTSAPLSETTSSPTRPSTTLCLTFGHTSVLGLSYLPGGMRAPQGQDRACTPSVLTHLLPTVPREEDLGSV